MTAQNEHGPGTTVKKPAGLDLGGIAYWWLHRTSNWFCRLRRWPVFGTIGRLAGGVHRAYENRNFEMSTNGEEWVLKQMAKAGVNCVFDVGACDGEWSAICLKYNPEAVIHAFDGNSSALLKNVLRGRHTVNSCLLSDKIERLTVYAGGENYLTSVFQENASGTAKEVSATTGDQYCLTNGISKIDILKIDVEGMEGQVLRGFATMLGSAAVRLVQFEYNTTSIASGFTLMQAYKLLSGPGYIVGKVYPNHVEFRDYQLGHEDYCGPNMVAIRRDDQELRKILENK